MKNKSATDYRIIHLTFLKDDVNTSLQCASSRDTNLRINRDTAETKGLILCKTQNPTNALCHLNSVHITHEDDTFQLTHIDTFRQNRAVKNNKFLVRLASPSVQSVEELLTGYFPTITIAPVLEVM